MRAQVKAHAGGEPADQRLRELLAVETRLEELVREAAAEAARRVEAARAQGEQQLADARALAEQADQARSREERVAHDEALAEIEREHRRSLAAIAGVPDDRIDELARWAIAQVIDRGAET